MDYPTSPVALTLLVFPRRSSPETNLTPNYDFWMRVFDLLATFWGNERVNTGDKALSLIDLVEGFWEFHSSSFPFLSFDKVPETLAN